MSNYDEHGNWHPPQVRHGTLADEAGRAEYEAELVTRRAECTHSQVSNRICERGTMGCNVDHLKDKLVGQNRYDLFEDVIAKIRFQSITRAEQHSQLERIVDSVRPTTAQPAAVIGCFYDVVAEVPRNRAELTEIGKRLPRGTNLYAHPEPPTPKPLPKLPKVPADMVFGSGVIRGERVELRGWTTEMMQPWIDAVQALFKEQR